MAKLNFSGHESFHCRELWLKKGVDFALGENSFQNPLTVVELGVGKNMVNAIQYWMLAFGLLNEERRLTELANYIFGPDGKDPLLEDGTTLWLLHYQLIRVGFASIYSLFFNEFRKEKPEFNRIHLFNYLKRKCDENKTSISENTISKDVGVFLSTYLTPEQGQKDFKDLLTGLLTDLELIERISKKETGEAAEYRIVNTDKKEIPAEILLFCILDNEDYGDSISLHTLMTGENGVGSIFAMNANGIVRKIKEVAQKYKNLIYTDDAGVKEIQFKNKIDKWAVLNDYYGK